MDVVLIILTKYNYTDSCPTGAIRLVGAASNRNQGTVELCYENIWGSICSASWSTADAGVACKALGFYGNNDLFRLQLIY